MLSSSTTLVSVTAGGNDVGFADVMQDCVLYSESTCVSASDVLNGVIAKPKAAGPSGGYLPAFRSVA